MALVSRMSSRIFTLNFRTTAAQYFLVFLSPTLFNTPHTHTPNSKRVCCHYSCTSRSTVHTDRYKHSAHTYTQSIPQNRYKIFGTLVELQTLSLNHTITTSNVAVRYHHDVRPLRTHQRIQLGTSER